LDLKTMQLKGDKHSLWDGALKGNLHTEAPHLYKINGTYYLMVAEAGTGHNHAMTIARSEHVTGPYEGNPRNPILTHRHLGLDHPIVGTGHADLVETQGGEWWMVLLAMRPYGGYFYNLGRETFLVPVSWEDGWPIVSPGVGRVEFEHVAPDLPQHQWPARPASDHFEAQTLAPCWNFLRTPREEFWSTTDRPGYLRLRLRPQMLSELANLSFVGRRQQHINFAARVCLEFAPKRENECAGIVLLQNNDYHFRFVIAGTEKGSAVVRLIRREAGEESLLAERRVSEGRVYFRVEARGRSHPQYPYGGWFRRRVRRDVRQQQRSAQRERGRL
jgi:xylan 1,4-beta-xylosidase